MTNLPELWGSWEVCEALGVDTTGLRRIRKRKRPKFPEPVAELRCGPIWLGDDVAAWLKRRERASQQP